MSFFRRTEGAVYAEFLIAIMPVWMFTMCIFQQTEVYAAQLLTEHAAFSAARAASVVIPDNPNRYSGEAANTTGQKRTEAVRLSAIRALSPFVQNENVSDVQVDMGQTAGAAIGAKSPVSVTVTSTFKCKIPIAAQIVCDNGELKLSAKATMPNQGASYTYEN